MNYKHSQHNLMTKIKRWKGASLRYSNFPRMLLRNELPGCIRLSRYLLICGTLGYTNLDSKLHCAKCGMEQNIKRALLLRGRQIETRLRGTHKKGEKHEWPREGTRQGGSGAEEQAEAVDHNPLDTFSSYCPTGIVQI